MGLDIQYAAQRLLNRVASTCGGFGMARDPSGDNVYGRNRDAGYVLAVGIVTRAGAGSHDCVVSIHGRPVTCDIMSGAFSPAFGTSMCNIPLEGTAVLVVMGTANARLGTVIGTIPNCSTLLPNGNPASVGKNVSPDPVSGPQSEIMYREPMMSRHYTKILIATSSRYIDVLPGEYSAMNDAECGLNILAFSAELRGGAASVKASRLDSAVRVNAMNFQMYLAAGTRMSWNDNGYVSEESKLSFYQSERLGMSSENEKAFEESNGNPKTGEFYLQNKKKRQTAKARFKSFVGYLGGVVNHILCKPDPDCTPLSMDDKPKDTGVFQSHVDGAGTLNVRSAGGVTLERYDRIPVPHRMRDPWDPEGDKGIQKGQPVKPFEYRQDKFYRSLELYDGLAWERGNDYSGITGQKKDFYLPEEGELKEQTDKWDEKFSGAEPKKLAVNKDRRAGVYIGEDGSVIIRDAWGSEIVMNGGCINISCAGNVNILPAKTAVVMAGDDAVVKAYNSVDINATEHDVRVKAEHSVEILGGSDDSDTGGVLIESKAKNTGGQTEGGENGHFGGVVIQAPESGVAIRGKKTNVRGVDDLTLESGAEGGSRGGNVTVNAGDFTCTADKGVTILNRGGCLLITESGTAILGSSSSTVIGGPSTSVFRGTEALIPLMWHDIGEDPVGKVLSGMSQMHTSYQDDEFNGAFSTENMEKLKFAYRDSMQCGTTRAAEPSGSSFTFYQPGWKIMKDLGSDLLSGVTAATWEEHTVDGEYPWPGTSAYSANSYATLGSSVNLEKTHSKARKSLKSSSEISEKPFSSYDIAKT